VDEARPGITDKRGELELGRTERAELSTPREPQGSVSNVAAQERR